MRILVISNYYPPFELGGWGQLTRDVSALLRQRGHEVQVLVSNHRADELSEPEPEIHRALHLESPDHEHYHLSYTAKYRQWEAENRRVLATMVADFQPDLIFINGMWNLPRTVAVQAENLAPVVYWVASYWPTEPSAHVAFWQAPTRSPVTSVPKRLFGGLLRQFWLDSAPRHRLRFELVLCVSEYMRQKLLANSNMASERVHVVHNGVEVEQFTVNEGRETAVETKLLYAGRLSPDKGVHVVLEAMAHLDPALPVTLSIVGAGTQAYEEQLRQLVQDGNLADKVTFQGWVAREQMPAILDQHHVLMFPSIWPEPLSRMVQEGMACGLVVIGTETGGTPEILSDGENGLTYPAEDPQTLAKKITQLVSSPDLRTRLAKNARQTVETHFTLERMVDELEDYFKQVI